MGRHGDVQPVETKKKKQGWKMGGGRWDVSRVVPSKVLAKRVYVSHPL